MNLRAVVMGLTVLAASPLPGQDLPQWVMQLSRVKRQAKAELVRLPDFACVETIRRFEQRPHADKYQPVDTIRVDVAFVGGKELVAQPGASGSFQEMDLRQMAYGGAIGTGAFSAVARNIFVNDNGRTTGMEEDRILDTRALRFRFVVPEMQSGYTVNSDGAAATVGLEGMYWADAENLRLLRVEEHAVEIPPNMNVESASTVVDYAMTRIGSSDVLLPRTAELLVVNRNGWRGKNEIEFTGCREYVAESVIRFDSVEPPPPVKKK